jgi:hypothetical protein
MVTEAPSAALRKPSLALDSEVCPHCEESLVGREIPAKSRTPLDNWIIHTSTSRSIPIAVQCPLCDSIDVLPGMEDLWREEIARRAGVGLAELDDLDILTFDCDGCPIFYSADQRDRDKGRNWAQAGA